MCVPLSHSTLVLRVWSDFYSIMIARVETCCTCTYDSGNLSQVRPFLLPQFSCMPCREVWGVSERISAARGARRAARRCAHSRLHHVSRLGPEYGIRSRIQRFHSKFPRMRDARAGLECSSPSGGLLNDCGDNQKFRTTLHFISLPHDSVDSVLPARLDRMRLDQNPENSDTHSHAFTHSYAR